MKKICLLFLLIFLLSSVYSGCTSQQSADIAATTLPVYEFTAKLCQGTDLQVVCIVTENVSCLHDYSLQTKQMRILESADLLVISGAGLEDFLSDVLDPQKPCIDASANVHIHEMDHDHETHAQQEHTHDQDPHIWLSPENAKLMADTISTGLLQQYPQHAEIFQKNLALLHSELDALQAYGVETLSELSCRELITFHDGFSYFAESFDLKILRAIEEESGSEASAAELIDLIQLVSENRLPCVFTERNGSLAAAEIVSAETGTAIFPLDMAIASESYFDAMYHNIDTIKEALK